MRTVACCLLFFCSQSTYTSLLGLLAARRPIGDLRQNDSPREKKQGKSLGASLIPRSTFSLLLRNIAPYFIIPLTNGTTDIFSLSVFLFLSLSFPALVRSGKTWSTLRHAAHQLADVTSFPSSAFVVKVCPLDNSWRQGPTFRDNSVVYCERSKVAPSPPVQGGKVPEGGGT